MLLLSRLRALPRQLSPAVLAPAAILPTVLQQWRTPPVLPPTAPLLLPAVDAAPSPPRSPPQPLLEWLDGLMLMAVPKKKISYTRKRVRQAGHRKIRGPFLQSHMSMCPVCERMRAPHRVCGREDCQTYWRHRWM